MTLRVIFTNGREETLPSEVLTSRDLETPLSFIHDVRMAFSYDKKSKSENRDFLMINVADKNDVVMISIDSNDPRYQEKDINQQVDFKGVIYNIKKIHSGTHFLELETQWSLIKMVDLVDRGVDGVHFSFNHEHYQHSKMSSENLPMEKSKLWTNSHQVSLPNESKALMTAEEVGQLMTMHFNVYQKCIRHAFSSPEAKEFFEKNIRSGGTETDYTLTKPLLEEMMHVVFGEEFVERRNQALLKEKQNLAPI